MGSAESKAKVSPAAVDEKKEGPEYEAPENDYQLVFEAIKDLEHILMFHFDSSGDSLHEMIATTNHKLPVDLIVDMRALATIRNNMAHEYSSDKLVDRKGFIETYRKCTKKLDEEIKRLKKEEEKFYQDVLERHRQLHPRPTFILEDEKPLQDEKTSSMCGIQCF
jgi:hypothetical protein